MPKAPSAGTGLTPVCTGVYEPALGMRGPAVPLKLQEGMAVEEQQALALGKSRCVGLCLWHVSFTRCCRWRVLGEDGFF